MARARFQIAQFDTRPQTAAWEWSEEQINTLIKQDEDKTVHVASVGEKTANDFFCLLVADRHALQYALHEHLCL